MAKGRTRTTCPGPGVMSALGFAGLDRLAAPLLAALATGDPLLLVGGHGSAKSALCRAVAEALGLRFHAYDAGKALFEDVVGFPDPASLAEGRLRYVPTPLSIWDREFVLVDELSRASPQMQNKWLEVVRARRIMGAPVPGLRHVWAAMNPLAYLGAQALDAALAGRFAWIVSVPDVGEMAADEVARVVCTAGPEDAPLAGALHGESPDPRGARLGSLVDATRAALPAVVRDSDADVVRYIQQLAIAMPPGAALDGRRMAMLRRNLLSAGAAVRALAEPIEPEVLFRTVLLASLPFAVVGVEVDDMQILCAHDRAWGVAMGEHASSRLDRVLAERDARLAAAAWAEAAPKMREDEHDRVVARYLDAALHAPADRRVRAWADIVALVEEVAGRPAVFPPEIVARLLSWYARHSGMTRARGTALGAVGASTGPAALSRPADALALRLALEVARPRPGSEDGDVDVPAALQAFPSFRTALRRRSS